MVVGEYDNTRSPTCASEIALISPPSYDNVSEPAKHELEFVVGDETGDEVVHDWVKEAPPEAEAGKKGDVDGKAEFTEHVEVSGKLSWEELPEHVVVAAG